MTETLNTDSITDLLAPHADDVEQYLRQWLVEDQTPPALAEAMRYCVLEGGKRLRPALVLMTAEAIGGKPPCELARRGSVAVELIHCYSLVHDDLPSMDNDEMRRGKPTAHVKFGEAMAILVGDALLTRAFGVLGESDDPRAGRLVGELASAAGAGGMVGGQTADMHLCDVPDGIEGLDYIHSRKTARLISAAATMGAICGGANESQLQAVDNYGRFLGMTFQLIDDLLDVTAQAEVLGKTPGKDQAAGKRTHVSELGVSRATELADELTRKAVAAAAELGESGNALRRLGELLTARSH